MTLTDQQIAEAERIIDDDAAELERLKKDFFTQPLDVIDDQPLTKPARRKGDPTLKALGKFARVLETAEPRARMAAIAWLADKYLGVKIR